MVRKMRKGEITDVGRMRTHNEDAFYSFGNNRFYYGLVADGMGGHHAGEIASRMAVYEISEYIRRNLTDELDCFQAGEVIRRAFAAANDVIYKYAGKNLNLMGMGTTAVLAMYYDGRLITANVGDSRAYLIGSRNIRQITRDHSYVAELVAHGSITPEQARNHPKRNYITRAIGTDETVETDIKIMNYSGETVLLCSDGLTNMVSDKEIQSIVGRKRNLKRSAEKLAELANRHGGTDNITAVLYRKDR